MYSMLSETRDEILEVCKYLGVLGLVEDIKITENEDFISYNLKVSVKETQKS